MKIASVYDVIYPFGLGGGERRNWEIAKRLAAHGHKVELVSVQMWDGDPVLIRDKVRCVGVCPWRQDLTVGGKRSFWEPLYFARHLYSYLRRQKFDIIDCGSFPYLSCLAARAAALHTGAELVVTWYEVRGFSRWVDHRGWLIGPVAWLFETLVSKLTAHNVAISDFTAERARWILGMKNAAVIPCGVDLAACGAQKKTDKVDQFLYVGRLIEYKQVDLLIEAFAHILASFPQYRLKIVGRGYERAALGEQVRALGLEAKVDFVDALDEAALYREFALSRAFVLPSEQEGFGMVLLEAMAVGTPVLAMDAPNSAAGTLIYNGRNGLLFTDRETLTAAMWVVLHDEPRVRSLVAGGRSTAAGYDWGAAVVPAVEEYYRKILKPA